ncbi:MAG TPA: MlaD family protein [Vicinamibacterales bacterium]|nr:MlaD family protein [Vicinamibacterales bacterium]
MSSTRTAMVGAFVLGGFVLFAAGLFLIGDRRLLFADQFEVTTSFTKVTGLQVGTNVRVAGLDAGEVLEIRVPSVPSQPFVVRMRLRQDLHHLVRTDSVCSVHTDGIVGSAFIQVSPGSDAAPIVAAGQTLEGRDMIEFADLIQEGRDTFRTVTREVIDLKGDVSEAILAATEATRTVDAVILETGNEVQTMMQTGTDAIEEVQRVVVDARGIVNDIRAGQGTVGQLVTDDALYLRITGLAGEAEKTMANLQAVTDRARATFDSVTARDSTAQQMMRSIQGTLAEAQEVMSDLSEGTEALKRNILFRGFFRDRGFFDLDAITRDAYVAGALEGDRRVALRVWIEADGLFARDAEGVEQLTEAGRRRLDSSMADLVRYPRDSPLVVEGYARVTDGGAAHLIAAERAALVRDYLLSRFRRRATLTGIMAMGSQAPGSPSGDDRWSGVALTLFVDATTLSR